MIKLPNQDERILIEDAIKELADYCENKVPQLQGVPEFWGRIMMSHVLINPDLMMVGINPGKDSDYAPYWESKLGKEEGDKVRKERISPYRATWFTNDVFRFKKGTRNGFVYNTVRKCFTPERWDMIANQEEMPNIFWTNVYPIATRTEKDLNALLAKDPYLHNLCLSTFKKIISIVKPKVILTCGRRVCNDLGVQNYKELSATAWSGEYDGAVVIGYSRRLSQFYNSADVPLLVNETEKAFV